MKTTKLNGNERRIANLVQKAMDQKRGNIVRRIVNIVAKSNETNVEGLVERQHCIHRTIREMEDSSRSHMDPMGYRRAKLEKLAIYSGIISSALYQITGEEGRIKGRYGGLGATITNPTEGSRHFKSQLKFAKTPGHELRKIEKHDGREYTLENSIN